jgi:hypothetical protein
MYTFYVCDSKEEEVENTERFDAVFLLIHLHINLHIQFAYTICIYNLHIQFAYTICIYNLHIQFA